MDIPQSGILNLTDMIFLLGLHNMNPTPRIPPMLGLAFGILAASTAAIIIRFAQEYASSLVIAAYRLGLATLILIPFVLFSHFKEVLHVKGKVLFFLFLAGIFLAFHFAFWITSLEYTSVASSVMLVTTIPIWVAILSPFTIHEKMGFYSKVGMVVALIGGVVIGVSDSCNWANSQFICPSFDNFIHGEAFIGDVLALLGAIMAACYLLVGRSMRDKIPLLVYIFIVYGIAALFLLLIVLLSGNPLLGYPKEAYIWFFLLALFPQLLGHSSFNWALRFLPASYVSIALLGEPIGSTILAYFILGETPTIYKVIGGIVIFIGIYIASKKEKLD
jgi:drug/metabolite transporter (DMT)-like permease